MRGSGQEATGDSGLCGRCHTEHLGFRCPKCGHVAVLGASRPCRCRVTCDLVKVPCPAGPDPEPPSE